MKELRQDVSDATEHRDDDIDAVVWPMASVRSCQKGLKGHGT